MQNQLEVAINTPDREQYFRAHAEPLKSLNEIQNRSLEKALKSTEKISKQNGGNVVNEIEKEELKSELNDLDVAGESWKPSGINKNVSSPQKYSQTVVPGRKNVMFTDDGEMIVLEKKGTSNKQGRVQTPKKMTVTISQGGSVPVNAPHSVRSSGIPKSTTAPSHTPAPSSSSSSSVVQPHTVYALTPLSTPVQTNGVGSPGRTPTTTPGTVEGVIDKLDRMASILESQFKMFQDRQQQQQLHGYTPHAHASPRRKGDVSSPLPTAAPSSHRHSYSSSSATPLPAAPLMSPSIAKGAPQQPQSRQQQLRFEMTPQAEQQFEMANGASFSQFMAEFNDLKQQVLAQTPAKGYREGGSSLLPTSSKQKNKYLEERRQASQKAKVTSSVSRKAADLKSENSEVDDIINKPWYQRRAYAKSSIEETMRRSKSPPKERSRERDKSGGNGNGNGKGDGDKCDSVNDRSRSPSKQRRASSPSPERTRERSNSLDMMQTLSSSSSSTSSSNLSTGFPARKMGFTELPIGVTEIPIKSSLSSAGYGKGGSPSRRGDVDDDNGLATNALTIESLKLKLEELSRQLEEAEKTELFDADAGMNAIIM